MMAEQNGDRGQRHAEYKIPGGKLVVVDFRIEEGRLHDVQLSGDFFLEPPEVLTRINAALENMPQGASARQLEAAVQSAIKPDATLFGITTAGVVTVVQRALA